MLAAWMRMKHPHVIQGALAASAPIFYFKGADGAPETKFFDIITEDFNQTMPGNTTDNRCGTGIKEAFTYFADVQNDPTVWPEFKTLFNLCGDITSTKDIDNLYDHLSNAYAYMAMTDYPTAANFLNPMPAFPVNASCEYFAKVAPLAGNLREEPVPKAGVLTDRQKLVFAALRDSADVYFDYDKKVGYCMKANDTGATGSLDGDGWNVL